MACGQIGFEFGVVSPAGCAEYGGASFCGASGSPVAAKALQCAGTEMSLKECKHDAPDDACLSHASDSVVFCGTSTTGAFFDGELRLIGVLPHEVGRLEMYLAHTQAWAPVCREGFTSGSAAVACKAMGFAGSAGFSGCNEGTVCGKVRPHVSALACAGSESSVTQCPMSTGDDVFCAPEESVAMSCAGVGDPIGKPV